MYWIHIVYSVSNSMRAPRIIDIQIQIQKNVYCHNVYKSGTNVWIIYTSININNSKTRATSYGKGSMKPNGFMGSIFGNTSNNMVLVGAKVQRVQGNYHHFDNV